MTRFNQPLGGNDMPRFGGPATMMRLPAATSARGLDAAFIGILSTHLLRGTKTAQSPQPLSSIGTS